MVSGTAFAQAGLGDMSSNELLLTVVLGLILLVAILVLVVAMYMVSIIRAIIQEEQSKRAQATGTLSIVEAKSEPSTWEKLKIKLTRQVPLEREEDIMMDHDYDGIKELDNHLPPWWKWLFYITIIWSVFYLLVYHVFHAMPLQDEEYSNEMAQAEAAMEKKREGITVAFDETNVEFSDDPTHLASGQKIFVRDCQACHLEDGGGMIGPNLTDEYWIHGGSMKDVFSVIKYGVPQKGMIPWQTKLNAEEMRDVASYVLSLGGTEPARPKAPEGELYVPEENPEEDENQQEVEDEEEIEEEENEVEEETVVVSK